MSLFLFAIVQSLLFKAALSLGSCKTTSSVELTVYGYPDGPGDTTSFSCGSNGGKAGGSGSYSNPETFATALSNHDFTNCEIVYIPYLQKYFQFSDHCEKCDEEYKATGALHIDLWIGTDTNGGQTQILCEDDFGSVPDQTIIQNPPSTLPVNSVALWDGTCHNAGSASPAVYPNPSSSGLCSGGSSSPPASSPAGGSPNGGQTTTAAVVVASSPISSPSAPAIPSPPVVVSPIQSPASSAGLTTNIAPTTLLTVTSVSSALASGSGAPLPTTATSAGGYSGTADCASWGGCLGDPCHTYNDCAGNWICMGSPKTCHDNRSD